MLVDQSARIWAMRRDEMMISTAMQERAAAREGNAPVAMMGGEIIEGSDFARIVDRVAIVPVRGMLMRQFSVWFWSYEEIARDIGLAQLHPGVDRIVMDFDSPGGLIAGLADCAQAIHDSGPKPVDAFVGGMAASAAYHLAAACGRITLGSGAMVGSIGVVIEYVDIEPMLKEMGARVIRIVAEQSPNKRLDPEGPEGRAELQALVNASGAEFVADVARFRGVSKTDVMAGFGQGLVFDGGEAIARGMADARGTLDAIIAADNGVLDDLPAGAPVAPKARNGRGLAARADRNAVPAPAAKERPMEWETLTEDQLRAHRSDIVEAIETGVRSSLDMGVSEAARDAAVTAAVAAERARMTEIDEAAVAGFEDLTAQAKADGWTAAAYALAVVKADKAAGGKYLAALQADDPDVPANVQQRAVTAPVDASDDASLKAQWDKDAELRAEFRNDFESYCAFAKAEAAGRVKRIARG